LLSGAAGSCLQAQAQDSAAVIEERIEAVFKIVPQNAADLAIPLTRRALARRSASDALCCGAACLLSDRTAGSCPATRDDGARCLVRGSG
jgi:hypothetical protein